MHKLRWETMNIEQIIGGKTPDDVRLLELFLQDYSKLFSTKVNPSCNKCLQGYLVKYKQKLQEMDSNCDYKLKKAFEGIPLAISGKGSSTSLNNSNLTNALAEKLIKRLSKNKNFQVSQIFEKFPVEEIKVKAEQVKPRRRRSSK